MRIRKYITSYTLKLKPITIHILSLVFDKLSNLSSSPLSSSNSKATQRKVACSTEKSYQALVNIL